MKYPVLIFYTLTTLLLVLVNILQDSFLLPYIEVIFVVFSFAESYYVLQNYDFDHGVPFTATILKLANTITILVAPLLALVFHLVVHIYLYTHIRKRTRRETRLKYHYTVNNVIPGPFLLKVFASFLSPLLFIGITLLANMRIYQKLVLVKRTDLLKYIILVDIIVFIIMLTNISVIAFLVYMIMLIIFEFVPIEQKL
ncbi:hypothetical protein R2F61_08780 [Mollicutes bacterium LVI A0078]|nr:hypothetical protein RZE84_08555 [Mollicutes bacterium LVI A0075]WOO90794.1 hypothetical protein R2F61_08780 [Mollicutes bacterium LVI A0078]